MSKRKSVGADQLADDTAQKSHRNDSSSSSTSGEWLCASTRVPLPGEAFSFSAARADKPRLSLPSKKRRSDYEPDMPEAPACSSSWLPFATTAAASFRLEVEAEAASRVNPTASKERRTLKVCDLRRQSLPASSSSGRSPRLGKTSAVPEFDTSKWPSFPTAPRKSAVLEISSTESPIKGLSDWRPKTPEGRPSSPDSSSCIESVVEDSQRDCHFDTARSLEDGRHGATKRIQTEKAESWPQGSRPHAAASTNPVRSRIANRFNAQTILDSSPDEVFRSSPLKSAALSQSTTTGTDASNEVVTATQEVVLESDDEERLKSERFLVDENTRLQSGFSSTEKHEPCPESGSGDSSESSDDEEDNLTRRTVARMSLTGAAREFADYLLARYSERVMARRDRNLATVTYDVVETVSMYGFSICWLSPKAIMYGPSFTRDPATVTLALPLETFPNESDPSTPIIVNPIIVSTTQEAIVQDSAET